MRCEVTAGRPRAPIFGVGLRAGKAPSPGAHAQSRVQTRTSSVADPDLAIPAAGRPSYFARAKPRDHLDRLSASPSGPRWARVEPAAPASNKPTSSPPTAMCFTRPPRSLARDRRARSPAGASSSVMPQPLTLPPAGVGPFTSPRVRAPKKNGDPRNAGVRPCTSSRGAGPGRPPGRLDPVPGRELVAAESRGASSLTRPGERIPTAQVQIANQHRPWPRGAQTAIFSDHSLAASVEGRDV